MKTRLVGDLHGHLYEFKLLVENTPSDVEQIIQLGDFGIGFGQSDYWHESLDEYMVENNIYFLRGNHDNPRQCKEMKNNLEAGIFNDFFVVPGAWSIDHAWRTPNVSWWEDEELSYEEFNRIADVYVQTKPRVVVTHDFPTQAANELFFSEGKPFHGKGQYKTRTASALQVMFEFHQPELWCSGHWHFDADLVVDKTRFVCLNELSYVDVERTNLELDFHPLWRPI